MTIINNISALNGSNCNPNSKPIIDNNSTQSNIQDVNNNSNKKYDACTQPQNQLYGQVIVPDRKDLPYDCTIC
ncbi:hypothetical protein DICPUDRAFT_150979 [Dictyostelium purpureum]|uniref:Uncharacterized protein n=1 Tax=Dictyostelium purpureum TaxID=5786 RepID=F0ZHQ4_DICPU|nr:uncharacterized protein DICPUDRAFT_150979 [Dictyostelium purpureum]EGC36502.1 hypothetical protein DICPUDRAFT_150979 [Dictyostelium purpureum]|eukprot:XP_003286947.1 hypothetical protein DICPUDRAFT_150979 [Dictyostelium purpureum]